MSVVLASFKSRAIGASVALAIGLHNIPEARPSQQPCRNHNPRTHAPFLLEQGLAVALPVYFASKSRWLGFWLATLSGLAEPLAAIVTALFLPPLERLWVRRDGACPFPGQL